MSFILCVYRQQPFGDTNQSCPAPHPRIRSDTSIYCVLQRISRYGSISLRPHIIHIYNDNKNTTLCFLIWELLSFHTNIIYIYIILYGWPSNIDYIVRRKLYWTRRSRVQYNLFWTVNHPILNILFTIKSDQCENMSIFSANGEILMIFSLSKLTLFWCVGTACAECP